MKITKNMKLAMARYYLNRNKPNWNKKADLEVINKLAVASGFRFTATAGTFRFECPIKRVGIENLAFSNCVIECDIDNFIDGGHKTVFAPSICGDEY